MTVQGHSVGTLLIGSGGLGKTSLVIKTVKALTKDFEYFNGYSTPLSLYTILFKHSDKLIILDDVEGIFSNLISTSILKAALWDIDGRRIVSYNTTSDKAKHLPDKFEFKGKIIVLCNTIPRVKDISVKATLSRLLPYKLEFTYLQKIKIIEDILKTRDNLSEEERAKIMEIIKKNTDLSTLNFNFRTMEHLIRMVKYDDKVAEKLFSAVTEKDENKRIVFELMQTGKSVAHQFAEFHELTGLSRKTLFNIRRRLKNEIGNKK
jgi:hypothetical protein